jgi:putative exporter of polyketide antibiotics
MVTALPTLERQSVTGFSLLNTTMQAYDIVTDAGLHFHVSLNINGICYIIVNDIFTSIFEMRYFNNLDSALHYVHSL